MIQVCMKVESVEKDQYSTSDPDLEISIDPKKPELVKFQMGHGTFRVVPLESAKLAIMKLEAIQKINSIELEEVEKLKKLKGEPESLPANIVEDEKEGDGEDAETEKKGVSTQ